jgi:hypothetical protein
MPIYSKSTPTQLRKRLQELNEELEARSPELVAEIRLVESLLKAQQSPQANTYASAVGPWEAIDLCLNLMGDFKLTKKEIKKTILDGGYLAAKPKAAGGLINDSLNHHIEKGRLSLKGDLVGRNPKFKDK